MSEFQIRKDNFAINRVVETAKLSNTPSIAEGEILVRVDRFAFTANNITYAVLGDKLGYWQFFPPAGDDADGWGIIPVWGFADVVASKAPEVPVGDRLFGYFPPAEFLTMAPARVTAQRLLDASAHRAKLPPGYNNYTRVNAEPGYDRRMDNARMLFWPLHMTSFCLWDLLKEKSWFDAKQIVILSASSKTSIGLAHALAADVSAPPAIAVTSARNLGFVNQLKLYKQATTYEQLTDIDAGIPTVIVDMSGNGEVLARLHAHLGGNMKRCINVGLTHWGELKSHPGIIAERSEFFFAPGHIQMRMKDWGPEEFAKRTSAFLKDTAAKTLSLLHFEKLDGLKGLAAVYPAVCEGRVTPDQGLIVEM
jgi:Protein of unknown function (DUF2855)